MFVIYGADGAPALSSKVWIDAENMKRRGEKSRL